MHIKHITICGFKSYRDKSEIADVDPGFNIIVGRNGSGKSNLFAACEFALTLEYRAMRPAERSNLLYLGKPSHDPAYVEIVFDNKDRKLSVNADTVTFRRMIATKKTDKFFVNGKELSNAKQFLDSAGFSNPYFIVKQGKVQELAVGTDLFRLKLLENVAGSTLFDEKLVDCKRTLERGLTKKTEIEELLGSLEKRKSLLETEASDLQEYLKLDEMRRAIEFILNEREQNSAKTKLKECDVERENLNSRQIPLQDQLRKLYLKRMKREEEVSRIKREIKDIMDKKELVEADIPNLVVEKEKLKNSKDDILNSSDDSKSKKFEVLKLTKELEEANAALDKAIIAYNKAMDKEENCASTLIKKEEELKAMEAKLQSMGDFRNVKQRDDWLNKEIKSLTKEIQLKKASIKAAENNFDDFTVNKDELSKNRDELQKDFNNLREQIQQLGPRADLFHLQKSRSETWGHLNETEQKLAAEKDKLYSILEELKKRVGRPTMQGCNGINLILNKFREQENEEVVNGYYGLVIENIKCDQEVDAAIESAAGNKLFHHIVKNHQIGMQITREFNAMKLAGIFSFVPIEGIEVNDVTYPEDESTCKPILNIVSYRQEVGKVIKFIFGRTLLCRTLVDAGNAARLYKMNCVTMDGDKVFNNGPIRGGYIQSTKGKLAMQRLKLLHEREINKLLMEKSEMHNQIADLERKTAEATKLNESQESKKCRMRSKQEMYSADLRLLLEKIHDIELKLLQEMKNIESQKRSCFELECRKTALEEQLLMPFKDLSQDDRKSVQQLRKTVKTLMIERSKALSAKTKAERVKTSFELKIQQLNTLLNEEINKVTDNSSQEDKKKRVNEINKIIESIHVQIQSKEEEINSIIEGNLPTLNEELSTKQVQLEKTMEKETLVQQNLNSLGKFLEGLTTRYYGFQTALREAQTASRTLGSLPSCAEKYEEKSSKNLYSKLKKLNVALKDKESLNQKAVEQYKELTEKQEIFEQQLKDLEDERESVDSLIYDVEHKKGEVILNNFRVLQQEFRSIFSEIVPTGEAELVLYGKDFEINQDTQETGRLQQSVGSGKLRGVKINVSFSNRNSGDMRYLLHLSGGQKSVVSLCLILAIQKIDPVPFYLFDEVDQALDPQYRKAVTKVIYDMASEFNLQFICTTFSKEFLTGANKFYGVSYNNLCSSIQHVTQEEAHDFVENEEQKKGSDGSSSSESPPSSSVNMNNVSMMPPPPPKRPHLPGSSTESDSSDSNPAKSWGNSSYRRGRNGGRFATTLQDHKEEDEDIVDMEVSSGDENPDYNLQSSTEDVVKKPYDGEREVSHKSQSQENDSDMEVEESSSSSANKVKVTLHTQSGVVFSSPDSSMESSAGNKNTRHRRPFQEL